VASARKGTCRIPALTASALRATGPTLLERSCALDCQCKELWIPAFAGMTNSARYLRSGDPTVFVLAIPVVLVLANPVAIPEFLTTRKMARGPSSFQRVANGASLGSMFCIVRKPRLVPVRHEMRTIPRILRGSAPRTCNCMMDPAPLKAGVVTQ